MYEKTGLAEAVAAVLDSKRVSDMDAHERHALAKKLKAMRTREEVLKQYPHLRYK